MARRRLLRVGAVLLGTAAVSVAPGCGVLRRDPEMVTTYSNRLNEDLRLIAEGAPARSADDVLRADAPADWDSVWGFSEGTRWSEVHTAVGGDVPRESVLRDDVLILVDQGAPVVMFSLRVVSLVSSGLRMSRAGRFRSAPTVIAIEFVE